MIEERDYSEQHASSMKTRVDRWPGIIWWKKVKSKLADAEWRRRGVEGSCKMVLMMVLKSV